MSEATLLTLIGLLTLMNLVQIIFWTRQVQKLVDKLMSRNYFEYSQALSTSQAPKSDRTDFKVPLEHREDFGALSEFGGV